MRITIIHVGALGDLLVATAALREICAAFPMARIRLLGSPLWKKIIRPEVWPCIDEIINIDEHKKNLKPFWRDSDITVNLRSESYRYAFGPWWSGVAIRVGTCPFPMQWLYTHKSPWPGLSPFWHERDRFLRLVEPLLATNNYNPGKVQSQGVSPTLVEKWQGLGLPRLIEVDRKRAQQLVGSDKYVLINPTSSRREKAWPSSRFMELCDLLMPFLEKAGWKLRVIGAPNETDWLREVLPLNGLKKEESQLLQLAEMSDLMHVIGAAQVLVTNTSSLQFIASSLATPVLTLMGNSDPVIWGPLGANAYWLRGEIPPANISNIFEREKYVFSTLKVSEVLKRVVEITGLQ